MTTKTKELKRYNLVMPVDLFNELESLANEQSTTVVEILRKFIKIGLLVNTIQTDPNSKLFIRENDVEREILII